MKIEPIVSFARRWAIVGILGFSITWIHFFIRRGNEYLDAQGDISKISWFADHLAFYTGARLTKLGPEDKVYDHKYVEFYQRWLFFIHPTEILKDGWHWLEAYRNPPFYAMLYWPTCEWPYAYSALFWLGISLGCYAAGTRWIVGKDRFWRSLLWVICFYPSLAALDFGQNPPLSFAIFAATFALLAKNRRFAAGMVAGLLLFKPNLLLGLGIWALIDIRRKWPCALGVITTGILLAGLSWIVLPTATKGFLDTFEENRKFDSFEHYKMHNPLAMARLLLPEYYIAEKLHGDVDFSERSAPDHPYYVTVRKVRRIHNIIALAFGLLAVAAFVKLYRHRGDDLRVMFGACVFLTLYANPHTLIYEWMLLAATGLLWIKEWKNNPNAWFLLYAASWGVLYFTTDLNWVLLEDDELWFLGIMWSQNKATVQWSVPVLTAVGWYALKLLTKPQSLPPAA